MEGTPQSDDDPDPDALARNDALRFVARRAAIWTAPLALVGLLLTGLGIPWWISLVVMLVVFAVVVFEFDI